MRYVIKTKRCNIFKLKYEQENLRSVVFNIKEKIDS